MTTWSELLARATHRLGECDVPRADSEARWMLEDLSGMTGAELLTQGARTAPPRAVSTLDAMVARRAAGEPLQYILGHWSFRGLDLLVDARVLIPRPETETLVEVALDEMAAAGHARGHRNRWTGTGTGYPVADLGTGSGAIALALAAELPDAEIWATDASIDALAVARANVAGCGATRVRLAEGSWFEALAPELRGTLRLVISNPPYIGAGEWESLDDEVRDHEPPGALIGGPDGFEPVAAIIGTAFDWLTPGGILVLETAPHQTDRAAALATTRGYTGVRIPYDLAGRARGLVARRPEDNP